MTKLSLCLGAACLCVLFCAGATHAQTVPFDSDRWQIKDQKARVEDYLGRKSLYLTSGYASLKDVIFEDGVVEVDIAAPASGASFVGLVFRFENEGEHEQCSAGGQRAARCPRRGLASHSRATTQFAPGRIRSRHRRELSLPPTRRCGCRYPLAKTPVARIRPLP